MYVEKQELLEKIKLPIFPDDKENKNHGLLNSKKYQSAVFSELGSAKFMSKWIQNIIGEAAKLIYLLMI